jgi:hypothetical protein
MLMLMSAITLFVVFMPVLPFDCLIMHGGSNSVLLLVIRNTDWMETMMMMMMMMMMLMMMCCDPQFILLLKQTNFSRTCRQFKTLVREELIALGNLPTIEG